MKKILLACGLSAVVFVMTGCGGTEKLNCTKKDTIDTGSSVTKINATFKGNSVESIDMVLDMKLKEEYQSYKDQMLEALDTQYKTYKDKKGIEIKTSKTDDGINVTANIDPSKSDESSKSLLGLGAKSSKAAAKKQLEEEGYTCK